MELALLVAVAVLVVGVIGSVLPVVPGALLSMLGVVGYWWYSGFQEPNSLLVVAIVVVCLLTFSADLLASAVSAKASGASLQTAALAGAAGFALLFVFGPLGVIIGVAGTVFALEFYRTADADQAARSALYTTAGMLASTVVQLLVTISVLAAFVLAVVL